LISSRFSSQKQSYAQGAEPKAPVQVKEIEAELTKLKEEQAKKEAKWEATQKQHEETLYIICS
jgi:hypothetical protein